MKLSGSYASIARGVSQQVAAQRLDGQHAEQLNLVSDPVIGLVRRRGSELRAYGTVGGGGSAPFADYAKGLRNFDFRKTGVQYTVLYPTTQAPVGQATMLCYNKESRAFLPVIPTSQLVRDALANGINKVTQVGDLLVMAVKNNPTTYSNTGNLVTQNPYAVLWVRNGAYQRTYKVLAQMADGSTRTAQFTTPSASYPGTLNTSDIPYDNPNYTKLVNDRVNSYNGAVTQWMTTAASQVQPSYIAQQLVTQINAWGTTGSILFEANHIGIENPHIVSISFTDGGDGTSVKSVWRTVDSVSDLPYGAPDGKVVEIRPNDGEDAYYMRADVAGGGWGKAVWREYAQMITTPVFMFLIATVSGGGLVVSASPTEFNAATGMTVPNFSPRRVGDVNTSPMPNFLGKEITYVGNFQDRLVVISGSIVNMSRTGDYFNFFRTSVLTVKDDDPVEVYALGADDDIIRHSVFFDKSMVLFGERQQYTIDGRVPITPGTTTVIQSSAHEDATDAAPVSRGELVFFAKRREELTKINQIEVGDVQDTSRVTEISLQLYDYIGGKPVQLLAVTNPDMLLIRSTKDYNSIVTFRYLDRGAERLLDSWSRWEYHPALGPVVGMSSFEDQIILFHHRVSGTGQGYIVAASQSLLTQVDDDPYLDCRIAVYQAHTPFNNCEDIAIAVGKSHVKAYLQGERNALSTTVPPGPGLTYHVGLAKLQGDYPGLTPAQCSYGFEFKSYVTLTSPYRRDQNGVAVTTGRLTVSRVDVSYRDTAGLVGVMDTERGSKTVLDFNGRLLGSKSSEYPLNLATSSVPMFIGRESREYQLTINAHDWRPFTLTTVEWTGQYFYNARR